ncbi:hypothetical protein B296_00006646 [Ensete ventricosum]|uniref:Uncharacterized protein n=1 Tax=Ensete ventricosum TaxID=4639 RepID=A0A426ZXC5_ENSVE|nr:hypothetical protein B296_00006646 [Ensete ventricosum]
MCHRSPSPMGSIIALLLLWGALAAHPSLACNRHGPTPILCLRPSLSQLLHLLGDAASALHPPPPDTTNTQTALPSLAQTASPTPPPTSLISNTYRFAFSHPNTLTNATSHLLARRARAPKAGAVGASNGSGQAEESIRSRRMAVHLSRGIEPLIVECTPDAYLEDPLLSRFGSHKIVERYSSGSHLDAYLAKVNKHTRTHPLVDLLTVASDLSVAPSEWTNVPHVDHGGSKALEEGALVACKAVDGGNSGGPAGREELLVGLQQPLVTLQVGEVVVVEGVGRGEVEIVEGCAVSSLGAVLLQSRQVGGVQRRVRAAGAAEVVEPAAEEAALRAAERVSSCVHPTPCHAMPCREEPGEKEVDVLLSLCRRE